MHEKLIIIKTVNELTELESYLEGFDYVAFDCETTGVDKESKIIGFSVCAEPETGYYVILSYWDVVTKSLIELETMIFAETFLHKLKSKSLIMQNGIFDCSMVQNNFGVRLIDSLHTDTLILGHLLNENRLNGLKERGVELFGETAKAEQTEMKESVYKNGGVLTRQCFELYKADADLIAKYGAKDAILTLKVFYNDVVELYEQGLETFFYEEESMPLLRGPTYDMNTTGLRVDPVKLQTLRGELETECMEAKAYIYKEITKHVQDKYKGTTKNNVFNIGSSKQLSWLLFIKLDNEFDTLTKGGKELCKALDMKIPYTYKAKREFLQMVAESKGRVYEQGKWNWKTKKVGRPKKVGDAWNYLACGKESLEKIKKKYKWVEKLLEYAKALKLLNTYVTGIQTRMQYNIIRPSFLQHGTTSGRYSSRNPNFQNLPRDDKRVKACIVARPGNVFVGADYSQLEPRVFASFSEDKRLLESFKNGDDFYSVGGVEIFEKYGLSLKKDDLNSFAKQHPDLRQIAKGIMLAVAYGTTASKLAKVLSMDPNACQDIIDRYFDKFPGVLKLMLESHEQAKAEGHVTNLFGRPRRMPAALDIKKIYGNTEHAELPYEIRNILNLAINHRIQSTGASIMNRAAIKAHQAVKAKQIDPRASWNAVKLVMQVHDELILECPESIAEEVVALLKDSMENTTRLPGVDLIADPKIAYNIADLK